MFSFKSMIRRFWSTARPRRLGMPARGLAGLARPNRRGQSMVEIALAAPTLIMITLGVSDLGRAFFYKEAASNTARQAIRLAAQDHTIGDFACANGGTITRTVPDSGSDVISHVINTAALESTTDGTASGSSLKNTVAPTSITLVWHCSGSTAITNSTATTTDPTAAGSDSIEVRVDYSFKLITPLVGGLFTAQTVHIRADQYGRAEY